MFSVHFLCLCFVARDVWWKSKMCSRNHHSLHVSQSRCSSAQSLIWLSEASRHFARVRSLSLQRGLNMASATISVLSGHLIANFDVDCVTLSALCACRIALMVARCRLSLNLQDPGQGISWILEKVLLLHDPVQIVVRNLVEILGKLLQMPCIRLIN